MCPCQPPQEHACLCKSQTCISSMPALAMHERHTCAVQCAVPPGASCSQQGQQECSVFARRLSSMLALAGRSPASQGCLPSPATAMHQVHTCASQPVKPAQAKPAQGSGFQRPGAWGRHTACWWRSAFWGMPQMSSRLEVDAEHMPGLHSQLLVWVLAAGRGGPAAGGLHLPAGWEQGSALWVAGALQETQQACSAPQRHGA